MCSFGVVHVRQSCRFGNIQEILAFLPRCSYTAAVMRGASLRLSVKRVNCDKTKESSVDILTPYERKIHLVFWHEECLVGDVPVYLKFWVKLTPVSKTANFDRYLLVAPQPLQLATTSFAMSPRWTAYVALKPPKGGSETQIGHFPL